MPIFAPNMKGVLAENKQMEKRTGGVQWLG